MTPTGQARILLIEDDARIAVTVRRGLQLAGFAVDVCGDGEEGLWQVGEHRYDLVVLDLLLPRRDGLDVCAALRRRGDWTPVLVLTARDDAEVEARALAVGADDFVAKPFSFPVLVEHVRALLRRAQGGLPTLLQTSDLRLDPARHRCWRGDREIRLTAREFAVLEFLMRRVGRAVSKREILDGVWDHAFDGDPNIVEVYVRRLRCKIDEPFGRADIATLRGVGYRLGTA